MKNLIALGIGLLITLAASAYSYLNHSLIVFIKITGLVSVLFVFAACLTSGRLSGADKYGVNDWTENDSNRKGRMKMTLDLFLIALPNIIAAVAACFFIKR